MLAQLGGLRGFLKLQIFALALLVETIFFLPVYIDGLIERIMS